MKTTTLLSYFLLVQLILLWLPTSKLQGQQLDRTETGKWMKVAAFYLNQPAALKDLTEKFQVLKQKAILSKSELEKLQKSLDYKENQISQLYAENLKLKSKLQIIPDTQQIPEQPVHSAIDDQAIWFSVQVGAFKEGKIPASVQQFENLKIEKVGDLQKVMVGHFSVYANAKEFQAKIRTLGITDAWVVAYQNGERIGVNDVSGLDCDHPVQTP